MAEYKEVSDMTIDEMIKKYQDITNTGENCPMYCLMPCEECVQQCRQIAEWLEELKKYRTLDKTNFSDGYNKAIDDFVKLVKEHDWNIRNRNENAFIYGAIDKIAEQLKAGGGNEK